MPNFKTFFFIRFVGVTLECKMPGLNYDLRGHCDLIDLNKINKQFECKWLIINNYGKRDLSIQNVASNRSKQLDNMQLRIEVHFFFFSF